MGGDPFPTDASYGPTNTRNTAIGYTHIITSNLINDFRIGFNTVSSNNLNYFAENNLTDAGTKLGIPGFNSDSIYKNPGIPSINFDTYHEAGNDASNWYQDDRTVDGYDQVSWTHGKHTIMAGVELRKLTIGRQATNDPRGSFTFSGAGPDRSRLHQHRLWSCGLCPGLGSKFTDSVLPVKGSIGEWRDGFFVLDNWQPFSKLTLNYGLRYELPTVPYSLNGYARILNADETALIPASNATVAANFKPTPGFKFNGPNHNDWAPRVRLRLSRHGHDDSSRRIRNLLQRQPAQHLHPDHAELSTVRFGELLHDAGNLLSLVESHSRRGSRFANGRHSRHLCERRNHGPISADANALPVESFRWVRSYGEVPAPSCSISARTPFIWIATSMTTSRSLRRTRTSTVADPISCLEPYDGFRMTSIPITTGSPPFCGSAPAMVCQACSAIPGAMIWILRITRMAPAQPWISTTSGCDYGNSNWDIRNRFVGTATYELPSIPHANALVREALGGWQANTIVTIQSGEPFNVNLGFDQANVGLPQRQCPASQLGPQAQRSLQPA